MIIWQFRRYGSNKGLTQASDRNVDHKGISYAILDHTTDLSSLVSCINPHLNNSLILIAFLAAVKHWADVFRELYAIIPRFLLSSSSYYCRAHHHRCASWIMLSHVRHFALINAELHFPSCCLFTQFHGSMSYLSNPKGKMDYFRKRVNFSPDLN